VLGAAALPPQLWRELGGRRHGSSWGNLGQWVALPHPSEDYSSYSSLRSAKSQQLYEKYKLGPSRASLPQTPCTRYANVACSLKPCPVMSIHRNPSAKSHSSIKNLKTKSRAERKHQGKQRAIHNRYPDLELFYVLPTLR
jgi:hypothetical protein